MGCGGSGQKNQNVGTQRRRLSVGNTGGGPADNGADSGADEGDRGLMTSLNNENVLEILQGAGEGRKMSIGSQTDQSKTSFANKNIQQLGDELDPAEAGLGYTCRKGLKPESPNQDSWFVLFLENINVTLYAVFDGHGQKGHDVSNFVKDTLPKLIIRDQRFNTDEMQQMLKDCFNKMQGLIALQDRQKKLSAQMSGTTCTIAVHNRATETITIAHVADSTCILGKKEGNADPKSKVLTRDHKPNFKDERARIEKNGGRVVFDGYANHRIYAKNARYPGLNMSRCLGDLMGHQDCGITSEPETCCVKLTAEDQVLLLCSDGVWEFITPDEAVKIVLDFPSAKAMTAAERLAKEAWDRWIREEGGAVVDDITVVLAYLPPVVKT